MRKYHLLLLLAASLLPFSKGSAQDQSLHFMSNLFQATKTNPAFRPDNKFTFHLLGISTGLSNSAFTINEFDRAASDLRNFESRLQKYNYIAFNFNTDVLAFRFKVRSFDFNFNVSENLDFRLNAPGDFVKFLAFGNAPYLGQTLRFDGLGADFNYYHELGFGFSQKIRRVTYGAKFKYLVGVANASTERSNISLLTDSSTYAITGEADFRYNLGGLAAMDTINTDISSLVNTLTDFGNTGIAMDFGASYDINDRFTVNASVLNAIGYIDWKTKAKSYEKNKAAYTFRGVTGNSIEDISNFDFEKLLDSLKTVFQPTELSNPYRSRITPRIFLSGVFNINPRNKLGLLYTGDLYNDNLRSGYTVSFDKQIGRIWNLCFTYSVFNNSYNNVGFGTWFRIAAFQVYAVTDNALAVLEPFDTKNVNLRVGINWVYGRPKRKKDTDDQPRLEDIKAAADKDSDFVDDKHDACPDVAGLFKFSGCPDTDGDGVQDSKDACPALAGLVQFGGCPDKDGDGIMDSKDECPSRAGILRYNGCPDTDGDSIPDAKDACPGVKGSVQRNGCPDRDGDGVVDSDDACPDTLGLAIYSGCPDTDGDSIPDSKDACRTVAGLKERNGCPAEEPVKARLSEEEEEIVNKVFSNLEFETGNAVIKSTSYPALDALNELLARKPKFKLRIAGYTDNQGNDAFNQKLSLSRANAVKKYLLEKGVDESRILAEGYGKENPVAANDTEEGRARNRRVEFTILE
jgi:outer membrane protein OmpA-like peptidoglycan-associated protein